MSQKIAFVCNFQNPSLFKKVRKSFPFDTYTVCGKYGLFGLRSIFLAITKLKNKDYDYLIFIDEDCYVTDQYTLKSVLNYMKINSYDVAGVRDGGMISHRLQNPFAINNHFMIVDFKKIKSFWNESEILKHQYINQFEFQDDLSELPYQYDKGSLFEHYYCLHFWLRRKGCKYLFLNSKMHADGTSNFITDLHGTEFLIHTWYSRKYKFDEAQRQRIDAALNEFISLNNESYGVNIELTGLGYRFKGFCTYYVKRVYNGIIRRLK